MKRDEIKLNPQLDLILERKIDVPVALVWQAWTNPEDLKQWFCPRPWQTTECEIDLRPGGAFKTVMQSPEGETFANVGCYLEIIKHQQITWTDALVENFRPAAEPNECFNKFFTATLFLEDLGGATKYTAIAFHCDEASRKTHEEMGFHEGWSTALDQLVECIKQGNIR